MTRRLSGYIMRWQESKSGGWGVVKADNGAGRFFFHKLSILEGVPVQGARGGIGRRFSKLRRMG
jgi:hypothetical protein